MALKLLLNIMSEFTCKYNFIANKLEILYHTHRNELNPYE